MNILFYLKPKNLIQYVYEDYTLRQVLEKMEEYRYSAIPIIGKTGEYIGTISEGDILWYIKNQEIFNLIECEKVSIKDVKRHRDNIPIKINADVEDLINSSITQNFIPVIDDRDMFIGIVTRQDIIKSFYNKKN